MNIPNAFSYTRRDDQIILIQAEHMIPEAGRLKEDPRVRARGEGVLPSLPSDVSLHPCP